MFLYKTVLVGLSVGFVVVSNVATGYVSDTVIYGQLRVSNNPDHYIGVGFI